MAVSIEIISWLFDRIGFERTWSTLDVGESCLVNSTLSNLVYFADRFGSGLQGRAADEVLQDLSDRSTKIGDPQIPTTFLSEVFQFVELDYTAIDVVVARKGQKIDLNRNKSSDIAGRPFDLLMNFGTTEHLINQYNAFRVFHEVTKPGGHMFHLVPLVGYLDHGYFSYKPLFFTDLAKANGYDIVEMWAFGPQGTQPFADILSYPGMKNAAAPYNDVDRWTQVNIPHGGIAVLLRKTSDSDFRVSLELTTSAATE